MVDCVAFVWLHHSVSWLGELWGLCLSQRRKERLVGRRTSEKEGTEGLRGSSLSAQLLEIQAGTRPHGGQGLLSEESLVDSTPLKIWSWVRYQVETGQEEMLG